MNADEPNIGHCMRFSQTIDDMSTMRSVTEGLSTRAYMATKFAAALCANPGGPFQRNEMSGWDIVNCKHEDIASLAVALADVLIAQLSKP